VGTAAAAFASVSAAAAAAAAAASNWVLLGEGGGELTLLGVLGGAGGGTGVWVCAGITGWPLSAPVGSAHRWCVFL